MTNEKAPQPYDCGALFQFPCLHLTAIAYQRESLGTQIPNVPQVKKTTVAVFVFVGFGDPERTRTVDLQRDRLAC